MGDLVLAGATSGTTTLTPAAVSGTTTLTLPATTGTVLTTTSPKAGNVIQVVQGTYATQTNTTSSTFVDTGLTATITPTSNTSKILVLVSQNGCGKTAGNTYMQLRLVKNSTTLINFESLGSYTNTSGSIGVNASSTHYLDSPATTSATTYKTQFNSGDNSTSVFVQILNGVQPTSTITLMEIAA